MKSPQIGVIAEAETYTNSRHVIKLYKQSVRGSFSRQPDDKSLSDDNPGRCAEMGFPFRGGGKRGVRSVSGE